MNVSDLIQDSHNANRGTPRGRAALEKSLQKYGAGRSILLDKHNRIIAGNKTVQVAAEIGIDAVEVVETDGKKIIAVKRTDLSLDDKMARGLAFADNRVSELDLDWNAEELSSGAVEGVIDGIMFTEGEIEEIVDKQIETNSENQSEKLSGDNVEIYVFVIDGLDWINKKNQICNFLNQTEIKYQIKNG